MEIEFVDRLIDLLERSHLSELEYAEKGNRLRLVKAHSGGAASHSARPSEAGFAHSSEATPEPATPASVPNELQCHTITSPLAGVFYRAPATNQPEFVQVGDFVEEGQTLAIVEAMKILNSIDADKTGRLAEILVANGTEVEAGKALFVIEPKRDENV